MVNPVGPIWVSLACRRFAAKTPDFGGWISLDFLGFSRPNRDFSMGYEDKVFSSRFCRRERAVQTIAHDLACGRDELLIGQPYLYF